MKLHPNTEEWLCDLETTTEKQCTGELGGPDIGFCCLGRAAVVYERETGIQLPKNSSGQYEIVRVDMDNTPHKSPPGVLNREYEGVLKWIHLRKPDGATEQPQSGSKLDRLVFLNDSGKSFKEIAAIIRANPRAYLTDDAIIEE